ncbi:unnamed protein product [Heterobilharzia americana]|nr:unnamed protein product [Heterobilharzia americana]
MQAPSSNLSRFAMKYGVRHFSLLRTAFKEPSRLEQIRVTLDETDIEGQPGALFRPMKVDNPHKLAIKMVVFISLAFLQPFIVVYTHIKGG